jgi:hypothetical protein
MIVEFESELWIWDAEGKGAWTFVTVPPELSADIAELQEGPRRGFGAVRVRVRVGATEWATSIFPSKSEGAYIVPVKKAVRIAEGLSPGGPVRVRLDVVDV